MKADFDQIKQTTDLRAVVERYGIALKREGKDWRGKCPFHDDQKRPNFVVSPDKALWRCPACGAAGNVIQFVARMESLTEREAALKLLCAVPGVSRASELPSPQPSKLPVPPKVAAMLLARVASFYAKTLGKDRAGLEYLKTRGLDDPALLETFAVGYCNGSMREALPKGGEVVEQLKALGVLNEKGNEVFYGRVVVPIYDAAGNVAGLYGRRVGDEEPRHLYLRGERRGVFNGQSARTGRALILVESIFDAMSLWHAGHRNAVALCGADGWTKDHVAVVSEGHVTELYIALDNDEAGRVGSERLRAVLAETCPGVAVHVLQWPEGVKDANAFFSSRSGQDFAALLKAAKPPTESAERLEKEEVEPTAEGFAVSYGPRRYELCAVDKPSPSRLKATVRAVSNEPGRFAIDTVDFYAMRSKRSFIMEAARLFRETAEVIEADVNRLTLAAENFLVQRSAGAGPSVATGSDAERAEGMRLARNPDLIGELQRDLDKLGIIGERTNRLLLYLAMTSRKMEEPLAVQILSSSGAGKSHLQDAVLSLCPEEDLIKLTSLTDRALFYKGEDSLRHKAIAIAEVAGAEGARYALRNLISDKKLVIESTVKNPLTGRLETQVNTVNGPTAVFETTTNPDTDAETKSRYLLLSVDESPEQTQAILAAQRQSHTLEGRKRRHQRSAVLGRQHAFQRLLRPLVVVNPFEPLLVYGDGKAGALPLRRDHPKYLNLILVVTFLYQHQRAVKHDAELGDYVETTLEDIAIANELAVELFGQSLDELSSPSRKLLWLIGSFVTERAKAENKPALEIEWTRRELREAIQWTEARLRAHLEELVRLECVAASGGRWGKSFNYRLTLTPQEIEESSMAMPGIKNVETLRQEANLAGIGGNFAGQNGNFAGTSQAPICEVTTLGNPHEHKANGHHGPNLADAGGKRKYTLRPNGARISVKPNGHHVEAHS